MTAQSSRYEKSYADFGIKQSYHQLRKAVDSRQYIESDMRALLEQVKVAERRMVDVFGKPIEDSRILEIGPGQGMQRALYFCQNNEVITMDTDIIPHGFEPAHYWQMFRKNGFGRVAKTLGRELTHGKMDRDVWKKLIKADDKKQPINAYGNIVNDEPELEAYDAVMSWSVFEHVSDPEAALDNILATLKPGGIFYISLHLYTCNNGHHDIRGFTGGIDELPLWGHLRPSTEGSVVPSSYLNEWRLGQWNELFSNKVDGVVEILEQYEHPEVYGPKLIGPLREELADYSDDELLTVNLVYVGKKK